MRTRFPLFGIAILALLVGCGEKKDETTASTGTAPSADGKTVEKAAVKPPLSKLEITDTTPGKGATAAAGDTLYMLYKGTLADGTEFDSTASRGDEPFSFVLGMGSVIKGWDQGLVGMKVGGKRTLGIPWTLGYGEAGSGGKIGPKSDLYFEVELLDLLKKGDEDIVDRTDVKEGSGAAAKKGDTVTIHYTGTLINGKKFDSSKDAGKPFSFKLGAGEVVPGFDIGVTGMKVGGVRKVRIPPSAGYGSQSAGSIPPNSILNFEIELLKIG